MGIYSQREMVCELHKRKLRVLEVIPTLLFVWLLGTREFQALKLGVSGFETGCFRL